MRKEVFYYQPRLLTLMLVYLGVVGSLLTIITGISLITHTGNKWSVRPEIIFTFSVLALVIAALGYAVSLNPRIEVEGTTICQYNWLGRISNMGDLRDLGYMIESPVDRNLEIRTRTKGGEIIFTDLIRNYDRLREILAVVRN